MAVPRHKHTRASVGQRRMHIYISPAVLATCPKCAKPIKPHMICPSCGHYKGREFINVFAKLTKKDRKLKEKEIREMEKKNKKSPLTMEGLSKN